MYQSPSREDDNHPAGQEIYHLQWNMNVHYPVHNSPALNPVLSQINIMRCCHL